MINIENIGKRYLIGHQRSNGNGMREIVEGALRAPLSLLRKSLEQRKQKVEEFWALKDVSLNVEQGEVVGVIGPNGAGKSTLFKILSRITQPTCGRIHLKGRVASLLEVGTGFHPELTGRENIYMNGAILGMTRREIRKKFDEIVAFSEVEKFLDTPVKRYSSGMYVRLAFAVAAHLEPEILLVDEVLAVGDAAFQQKCMGKIDQVARGGRTILFVSHNMAAIARLCGRAFRIEGGRVVDSGDTERVVARYLSSGARDSGEVIYGNNGCSAPGSDYIRLESVRVRTDDGTISSSIDIKEPFAIEVRYQVLKRATNLRIAIRLIAQDGNSLLTTTDMDGFQERVREPGEYVSRCQFPSEMLNYGKYYVVVGCDFPMEKTHFHVDPALGFQIERTGAVGDHFYDGRRGFFRTRIPWEVERLKL